MCGIVGYTGVTQAAPVLLDGLSKLEYRGYDSAGIAVRNNEQKTVIVKAKGKLKILQDKTNNGETVIGTCGVGHTRWATHGEPSELNAHPHTSDDMNIIGVHNGIIENYLELKEKLIGQGYEFATATDTEVAIKLVDYYYKKYAHTPVDAINHAMVRIRGSFALALMFQDYPNEIFAARKESPMIIGVNEKGTYLASDVPAILKYTRDVYYIGNMEIGHLTKDGVHFYNLNGDEIQKDLVTINWDAEAAEKDGYEHFMIKEIHEQPKAIRNTLNSIIKNEQIDLTSLGVEDAFLESLEQIFIVACGSAYHAGVVGQYVIEELARVPVRVELASEFRYRNPILPKNSMVVIVSQSGETADSLAALRLAKENGIRTLAIVNVLGSTIAREADHVLYTMAGPEISVATTKAYSAQVAVIYCLAIKLAELNGLIDADARIRYLAELNVIPDKIESILENKTDIQKFAANIANLEDIFFIGRGLGYAIGLEASLKMKEISYIHSEAYAAGELKHGTISLIEDGTLVIGILTQPGLYEKMISNLVECKSRGARLMGLTENGNYFAEDTLDFTVFVPKVNPLFAASLSIIPLQLLAYYVSVAKGLDVDKPRNLAKSVTVE